MILSIQELIASAWFFLLWAGYTYYASSRVGLKACLAGELNHYRYLWMLNLLKRDNRIPDTTIIAALERNVTFLASSTLLILAGLLTTLASTDKAIAVVANLPITHPSSAIEWELKLLVLVAIFIYAFFKFTWCARQYGFSAVLIGGAPLPDEAQADAVRADQFARGAARVLSLAGVEFNMGLRSYYFGLSCISWFVHPYLFMLCTGLVVWVLYQREFHSPTLHALMLSHGVVQSP